MSTPTQLSIVATNNGSTKPLADTHDRVAEAYYGKLGLPFMRETQERIHWVCNNVQGRRVLDVGCSQGIVPILLAREGLDVIGIDTSGSAIQEATQYIASEPAHVQEKLKLINADFISHDFKQLDFDTIVISEVLEHLVQPGTFIETAAKLLPNNGRLIITVPFGINDFIDHKHTFYFLEPCRLILKHFEVKEITVLGRWLGIVANINESRSFRPIIETLSEAQIEQLENAFFQIERNLRDDLVATRKKLEDANQKYRTASEQVTNYKQRTNQDELTRITIEGHLKDAQAKFEANQERLSEANNKYREATEKVSTLKQRVTQEESARIATVKELEENQAQLTEARARLLEERTALQQKIERLSEQKQNSSEAAHEAEKQLIGLQAKFEANQDRLSDANDKYREATEQVSTLKQRVTQEESAHIATLKELAESQAQLTEARARLQEERTALQQKIEQLQAQGQSSSEAAHEAEKQLIGLQFKFEANQERLSEANIRYREAVEQVNVLKQHVDEQESARIATVKELADSQAQLTEARAKLQEERTALQQKIELLQAQGQSSSEAAHEAEKQLMGLQAKFEENQELLGEANDKYREAVDQVNALKQHVDQQESARIATVQELAESQAQLTDARARLQEERTALQQKIEQLQAQGQSSSEAAHEAEKQLIGLQAKFEENQDRLIEANSKYRMATEQVSTLKQRVIQEEAARIVTAQELAESQAQLTEARARLQEERTALQQKIEQLQAQGQSSSEAAHEAEKQLMGLQAKFEENQELLGEATEQLNALKQHVDQQESARIATVQELAESQAQLTDARARLQEERTALQQKIEQLQAQGQSSSEAAHEAEKLLMGLQAKFEANQERLIEANNKYRMATEQVSTLKQRVAQEEAARISTVKELEESQAQLTEAAHEAEKQLIDLQAKFEGNQDRLIEANNKYRMATEQVSTLKQRVTQEEATRISMVKELEESQAQLTEAAHEAEKQLMGLQAKFEENQELLGEANDKYREAVDQVNALKQHVDQQDSARIATVQELAESQTQLTEAQARLQEERTALQQKIEQLQTQGQSSSEAAHEAEKQLMGLQAKFEENQELLGEANDKYREATEQVNALKQHVDQQESARIAAVQERAESQAQLTEARARLQEERTALQQKIEQLQTQGQSSSEAAHEAEKQLIGLQAKFEANQERLVEASDKFREAVEQVNALKQHVDQQELARIATVKELAESQAQLTQAAHEAEKQLIGLQAKFEANQERLVEANIKYREATEQVSTLKQRVAQEESSRIATVKELAENQTQLTEAAHEAEKQLIGLQAKFEANQERLVEANIKYREATEKVSTLKQRVAQEESARIATVQELAENQTQLTEARARLQEERTALQQKIEQLQTQGQSSSEAAHEAEKQLMGLQVKFEENQERLSDANNKYREATEQISTLKQRFKSELHARKIAEKFSHNTSVQLKEANLKYRKITAEEIPNLKKKLEESYTIKRELQHAIEQLKLDTKKNKQLQFETNAELHKLHQQKIAVDQQVVKTRASLSFQLGYLLIHNVKSVRGIMGLPSALWKWRKEMLSRRTKQQQRQKALEIVSPIKTVSATVAAIRTEHKPQQLIATTTIVTPTLTERHIPPYIAAAKGVKKLKMACIMDEFTFGSYRHECHIQQLTPALWNAELEAFQPELLFIESAWRGKDELWGNKVGHTSAELQSIVAWCHAKKVPTVFWNKEDPVHFETFLTTAKLFDYVFTTDIDCIHRYKAALGHERVYLLPFACQPANNNPIETYDRKDAFCFAGAYYVKYPERTRDLDNFVEELPAFRPLEIYDRNFGKNDINYQFPSEYQPYIIGTLPFDQIDKAYKGYRYAINLNSIKQSQTMFARRVFELLASNTITVSNFSRGVRLLFGDLVITTDSGSEMIRHLKKNATNESQSRKLRLAALRKVMQEHTYAQRMAYVVSKVTAQVQQNTLPRIAVVALADSQSELDSILHHYQQQHYAHCSLLIVVANGIQPSVSTTNPTIRFVSSLEMNGLTLKDVAGEALWVTTMVPEDYYGPNYLLDIALATRYSDADVIGKVAHYKWLGGSPELQQADTAYRPAKSLPARSAAIRLQNVAHIALNEWLSNIAVLQFATENGLAIDEFNYCHSGAATAIRARVTSSVDDLLGLNTGISIDELLMRAERIAPAAAGQDESPVFTGKKLATDFGKAPSAAIKLKVEYDHWRIDSTLADGKHEYLYATADHNLKTIGVENQFKFYLDITPGLNIQLVVLFLDAQKQKISHVIKHPNRNQEADIPLGTASIRFGLRFYASGSAEIKALVLGHRNLQPAEMIGQSEHLVLTNHYPSYEDLYRNGFVHSRVRAYREHNVRCDVFRLRIDEAVSYHEFEDVDVTTGSQEVLHKMLCSGPYKSVLVHFLDPSMWEVLQHHVHRVKIVVWVHGAEIQPWHRRDFNYQTDEERIVAKMNSDKRMTFWRELLQYIPANLKLVFVSRYFAEEVMEDLGFRISEDHYTIIHNPINTDTFSYLEKPIKQRKKVLSIRPYASAKYANDLSVKAIQILSTKSFFHDMEFRMIGDGALFDTILSPLREFRNVYIEQRFLKQDEIAALHKEYGIFLCPTRMDAQGVSRDEAMSSGLVPVTNAVTAIPEFVDEVSGILAPGDDAVAMAEGIERLYHDSALFTNMSFAAAQRVRRQCATEVLIKLELKLFEKWGDL